MKQLIFSFLLHVAQCFPSTAGGNASAQVFFCVTAGCAANVTQVFCNDNPLFVHQRMTNCSGPPSPHTVCLHDRRAFVSSSSNSVVQACDFEGKDGYIKTEKCTDLSSICLSLNAPATSSDTPRGIQNTGQNGRGPRYIIIGLVLLALVSVLMAIYIKKDKCKLKFTGSDDAALPQPDQRASISAV